jgi:hypothetical protein
VFDTNAIFTKTPEELVSADAAAAIREHSRHGDLDVIWILPEIVRKEREYQMHREFRTVQESAKRASELLGETWDLSEGKIKATFDRAIQEQASRLSIVFRGCDASRVDWASVMHASAFRLPPFQPGQTEKGFRDAIVCETYVQVVSDLTGSDTAVLVTNDGLIAQALRERLPGARLLPDMAALRDEINLRVSNVDAETAAQIEAKASKVFFDFDDPESAGSFWARAGLYDAIWDKFGDRIRAAPPGYDWKFERQEIGTRLSRKEGNQLFLVTTYVVKSSGSYWQPDPPPQPSVGIQKASTPGLLGLQPEKIGSVSLASLALSGTVPGSTSAPLAAPNKNGLLTLLGGGGKLISIKLPDVTLEVHWSATYTRHKSVRRAKLTDITMAPSAEVQNDA